MEKKIPKSVIERIPRYLTCLEKLKSQGIMVVSSKTIAEEIGLGEVQVRKDLNLISGNGKPKIGHLTNELLNDIETLIFNDKMLNVIVIGGGKIGEALVRYKGFDQHGFKFIAVFDNNTTKIGQKIDDLEITSIDKLKDFCNHTKVDIGIITVPSSNAQDVCDKLIDCNIKGILNFTNQKLNVHEQAFVRNVDITSLLTMLAVEINNN